MLSLSKMTTIAEQLQWSYPCTLEELDLSSLDILLLATPSLEHWRLQGAPEAEAQGPRLAGGHRVDGIQMYARVNLALTTRQERYAWNVVYHIENILLCS